jgi:copper transport protein
MIGRTGCFRLRGIPVMILLAAVLLATGLLPRPALAHAVLIASSPTQGEHLEVSPKTLTLRFSETVTRVAISLVSAEGAPLQIPATIAGMEVSAALPEPLPDGAYALNWRVLSEDGHPVGAALVFAVGQTGDTGRLRTDPTQQASQLGVAIYITKFLFYASCLMGVGGTFFAFWIARIQPGRSTRALLCVAGICAIMLVGLLGLDAQGAGLTSIADPVIWVAGLESSLASSMAIALLSLCLARVAFGIVSSARVLSLLSIAMLGPAFALTGHASGAGIAWLSFVAVSIHVVAATFWAGALPGLWRLLGFNHPGQSASLARFSAAIPVSIATLMLAGTYLAWLQVGDLSSLWNTAYGNVLLVKLALVLTTLAIGAYNRLFLTAPAVNGNRSAVLSMKKLVAIEVLLVLLILAATALWRFTPPPRELAQIVPATTTMHIHTEDAMATILLQTSASLRFDAEVSLQTATFDVLDPMELKMRMSSTDSRVAAFEVPVHRVSPGFWRADQIQAPCECEWNVRLDVLVSDFDQVTLEGQTSLSAHVQ